MHPDHSQIPLNFLVSRYNDNPKNPKLAAFLDRLAQGKIEVQYRGPSELKILKLPHIPLSKPWTKQYPIKKHDPLAEFFGDLQPQITQEITIGLGSKLLEKVKGRYLLAESM
ncbi:MAG: hypothetical protein R3227_15980, partial [Reinekea sp.]|nr:hypothetical protein [Reinekea sp.]